MIYCITHYRGEYSWLTQESTGQHVKHAARGSHYDVMGFSLQLLDLVTDAGPSDAGVAVGPHVVTQSQHHLLDLKEKDHTGHSLMFSTMGCLAVTGASEADMCCIQNWVMITSLDPTVPTIQANRTPTWTPAEPELPESVDTHGFHHHTATKSLRYFTILFLNNSHVHTTLLVIFVRLRSHQNLHSTGFKYIITN